MGCPTTWGEYMASGKITDSSNVIVPSNDIPKAGKQEPVIILNGLPNDEKKDLWLKIRANRPDIADLLTDMKNDSDLQDLINYFGCKTAIVESDLKKKV